MKLQFPCDVCIELSKPIYGPGDTVEGTVVLRVLHEISCHSVTAQLRGAVTTSFTGQDELSRCSTEYKSEKVLVDETVELTNPQRQHIRDFMRRALVPTTSKSRFRASSLESYDYENFSGFKPGTHRFPIQFSLPREGLLTSFSARGSQASVKYSLSILIYIGGQEHVLHEHLVAVVLPAPVARNPIAGQAVVEDCATIEKNRSVHAVLLLSKTEFLPTDPLYCNITVTNSWKKSLKYVYFNVVQEVTSWAAAVYDKSRVGKKIEEVELTGVSLPYPIRKVDAGSTFTFSPEYYVTALVPNIHAPECLT
ncbi:Protein TTM-2, partial [Aphelenchoides avenae]